MGDDTSAISVHVYTLTTWPGNETVIVRSYEPLVLTGGDAGFSGWHSDAMQREAREEMSQMRDWRHWDTDPAVNSLRDKVAADMAIEFRLRDRFLASSCLPSHVEAEVDALTDFPYDFYLPEAVPDWAVPLVRPEIPLWVAAKQPSQRGGNGPNLKVVDQKH